MSTIIEPSPRTSATPPDFGERSRTVQRSDSPRRLAPIAFLLIEQLGKRQGARITGRVIIGRRDANHIVIDDRNVARIHAWIAAADGRHVLCDTGSRSGTLVNNRRIESRHVLQPGDVIRIGPATIHYLADPSPIADADPIDLTDRPLATNRPDDGQFVDCACGAPLWAPWDFAGKMGQCRYCGQTVIVQTKLVASPFPSTPTEASPTLRPTPPAQRLDSLPPSPPTAAPHPEPASSTLCGICQSPIAPDELNTSCPSCHTPFHADCWTENHGCSSYGCAQVNILDQAVSAEESPSAQIAEQAGEADGTSDFGSPPAPLPWEFLVLAGAVLGSILGAWTFGIPAIFAALAAAIGLRKAPHHRAVLLVALPFAVLGALAGIGISYFWWIASKHTGIPHR